MLAKLLEKNRRFNPTYSKRRLTNHLSMALIALEKMGASQIRLQEFFDEYSQNLELLIPIAQLDPITTQNWAEHLGQSDSYHSYLLFFTHQLISAGITQTLKQYVPVLITGIATDAFHCVIRLAYAIEINDMHEIACSLAYFASAYTILGERTSCEPISSDPEMLLRRIRNIKNLVGNQFQDNALINRFVKVTKIPEFSHISGWLSISDSTVKHCAKAAIKLYATTKNFTALHIVTATHAFRVLLPYLSKANEILPHYWQAFCTAYISIGSPEITEFHISDSPYMPWKDIFSEATKATDDHTIKLIYSCYKEDQIYHDPLYNYVATNAIRK